MAQVHSIRFFDPRYSHRLYNIKRFEIETKPFASGDRDVPTGSNSVDFSGNLLLKNPN